MSADLERFTRFLLRRAARYNAPPESPREAIWTGVDAAIRPVLDARRVGETPETTAGLATGSDDDLVGAVQDYHAPPVTPHDEMWERIESAWDLRRSAPVAVRGAGLDELDVPLANEARRRRSVGWMTGVGLAAAMVIGIAIGRTSLGPTPAVVPDGPVVAAATEPGPEAVGTTLSADAESPATEEFEREPLETALTPADGPTVDPSVRLVSADRTLPEAATPGGPTAAESSVRRPAASWNVAVRLATAKHLGQAETLLTSFRADTDGVPVDDGAELSGWARDLLGETRLLLDLPVERGARERELLEELELVLAQIARLGPDAPTFERDLVADGIVRQGTIARLRAAAPPGVGEAVGT
ncbi:MAG: hypothetical protein OEU54_13420 [Gemmatimonadota bacterium]|nr:hypothetical protein [Gemmatimonadota bacterium]